MDLIASASEVITPARKFALFGGLHLFILFITLALPYVLSRFTYRQDRPKLAQWLAGALAAVLIANRCMAITWGYHEGRITGWADALPMHLCDWASCAVIIALIWRGQLAYELAYLWGLSGTFQAVLTPDLTEAFPNPFFIGFFVDHCGIIVSVLFLTWGLAMRPKPGAVGRAWAWSQVYLICAALVDWTLGVNYGYLRAKPTHGSLLDYFGPWPWYILTLELMALIFFTVFYGAVLAGESGAADHDRSGAVSLTGGGE